jgi:hypothetical protein
MKRIVLLACLCLAVAPGLARAAMDRHYALQKASAYEDGCFAPCMCPVLIHDDLRGRFSLIPRGTENGYDLFDVNDVLWFVTLDDGSTILIQGSGRYRSSTLYKLQRLEMDLVVGERPLEHYDSGLVPIRVPSPELNITISKNGMYCRDTVFTIDAAPAPNDVRPPKLQFKDEDLDKGVATTWGRLKRLWTP